jgi:hypothetical protein
VQGGVVSVSSLWADEEVYYPLEVDPYTPAHHFEQGTLVEDSISMPANNKPPIDYGLVVRCSQVTSQPGCFRT